MNCNRPMNLGRWAVHTFTAAAALALGLALLAALPHNSRGQDDAVKQVLQGTGQTVQGATGTVPSVLAPRRGSGSGGGSGAGSRATSGGGGPHAQGSVGSVDLDPA